MLIRQNDGETEIDLIKCCEEIIKHIIIILLVSAIVAGAAYLISAKTDVPYYSASGSMYVRPYGYIEGVNGLVGYTSNVTFNNTENVLNTYIYLLSSDDVANTIKSTYNVNYTVEQLKAMISGEVVTKASAIKYSVSAPNPEDAVSIAKAVSEVLPSVASAIVEDASTAPMDVNNITATLVTKNYAKTALIAFAVAFFVLCMCIVLFGILKESANPLVHNGDEIKGIYPDTVVLNDFTAGNKENLLLHDFQKKNKEEKTYHIWEEGFCKQCKEGYRNLRSSLVSTLGSDKGVIGITDCAGNDNNIDVASNIAYSFALIGKKVIVIDTNVYDTAECAYQSGVSKSGLADIIIDDASAKTIVKTIDQNNHSFDLIPCGQASDADGILSSDKMGGFVNELKDRYDYVIMSFASSKYSDFVLCKSLLDGMVVVTKNDALYKEVTSCVEKLKLAGIKLLGFVIK